MTAALEAFEKWLRTVCFQKPTPEAYELAKCAWEAALAPRDVLDQVFMDECDAAIKAHEFIDGFIERMDEETKAFSSKELLDFKLANGGVINLWSRGQLKAQATVVRTDSNKTSLTLWPSIGAIGGAVEGFVMVPKEPTEEMCREGVYRKIDTTLEIDEATARSVYRAMLAAASNAETKEEK